MNELYGTLWGICIATICLINLSTDLLNESHGMFKRYKGYMFYWNKASTVVFAVIGTLITLFLALTDHIQEASGGIVLALILVVAIRFNQD